MPKLLDLFPSTPVFNRNGPLDRYPRKLGIERDKIQHSLDQLRERLDFSKFDHDKLILMTIGNEYFGHEPIVSAHWRVEAMHNLLGEDLFLAWRDCLDDAGYRYIGRTFTKMHELIAKLHGDRIEIEDCAYMAMGSEFFTSEKRPKDVPTLPSIKTKEELEREAELKETGKRLTLGRDD
ncbi:hypothetical protein PsorP6_016360 [Peronosclerospora sorghi]|uniref:Uncharacterized protein n=1 Tax=Peronosclerospora sorghi TaxID=230839 RepID=A0ACC0VMF4_9STRA|nr:hypothetical protein PsorP6_016360 [Peronosclerospora sorghi]